MMVKTRFYRFGTKTGEFFNGIKDNDRQIQWSNLPYSRCDTNLPWRLDYILSGRIVTDYWKRKNSFMKNNQKTVTQRMHKYQNFTFKPSMSEKSKQNKHLHWSDIYALESGGLH